MLFSPLGPGSSADEPALARVGPIRFQTRYFVPTTDIFETEDALTVVMEVPGVSKEAVDISVENDVLKIEAKIDPSKYDGMEPLYTEYNVGHFARSFTLSNKIDRQQIGAKLEDGVLTLTLKKAKEAVPHKISLG